MGNTISSSIVTRALSSISSGMVRALFESRGRVNARGRIGLSARQHRPGAEAPLELLRSTPVEEQRVRSEASERFDLVPTSADQAHGFVHVADAAIYLSEPAVWVDAFAWPVSR